jgi:ABC-type antimicrobial peptide transport system permease subunit
MEEYRKIQNAAMEDWPIAEFRLDNLYKLSVHSEGVRGDISGGSHPAAIVVLGFVGIFLLALSCFNYMNLAIATASRRLKEIGVRKVVGGSKKQLVWQFLSENILLCALALGLGVLIAIVLFIPGFNALFDFVGGGVSLKDADLGTFWIFMVLLLLGTGLISGAYPAFYIAGFRPTAIFQGRLRLGGGSVFTKSLLTLQFVLAFLTMIMGVVLAENANYQASRDWGYDNEHLLVVRLDDSAEYPVLRDAVAALPAVQSVVGGQNHFGRSWRTSVLDIEGEKMEAQRFDVGPGYLTQFGVRLKQGRDFENRPVEEPSTDVVVNETFARARGWSDEQALGASFRVDSLTYSVIGVVADFTYDDFYDPVSPAYLRLTPEDNFYFLTMKLAPETGAETAETVEATWKRLFPDKPYRGFFQDTIFDELYRENTNIKQLFSFIAILALVIACLGLFGLAAQNILRRMREISIRKVLGGSVAHISQIVNRGFLLIVALAAVIATPLGYFAMRMLLDSVYPDPVPLGPYPFLLSFFFVAITALFTVGSQVYRVAYNNPADVLRNE